MWSLPDIKRLNAEATITYESEKNIPDNILLENKFCEVCEKNKATTITEYFDVFSNTPKGKIFTCDDCYPEQTSNLFYCQVCNKYHVSNYTTWEDYFTESEYGETICLNCALDTALKNQDNFITRKTVDKIDFELIGRARHLIPVEGEYWKNKLNFVGNVEFDSMSGNCISGNGIQEIKELCKEAIKKAKEKQCVLILDATYQFAVSIGVYYKIKEKK